jgi:hypothetical protein
MLSASQDCLHVGFWSCFILFLRDFCLCSLEISGTARCQHFLGILSLSSFLSFRFTPHLRSKDTWHLLGIKGTWNQKEKCLQENLKVVKSLELKNSSLVTFCSLKFV